MRHNYTVVKTKAGWIVQNERFVVVSQTPYKTKEKAQELADNLNGITVKTVKN